MFKSSSGFSLIEALVGIAVLGVTAALVAPIVGFALSLHAQADHRAEAYRIAQEYIAQARSFAWDLSDNSPARFAQFDAQFPDFGSLSPHEVPPPDPASAPLCTVSPVSPCRLRRNRHTYLVQGFRTRSQQVSGRLVPVAFWVGVRVYSPQAQGSLQIFPSRSLLPSASNPLVTLHHIVSSDSTSLLQLCRLIDPTKC